MKIILANQQHILMNKFESTKVLIFMHLAYFKLKNLPELSMIQHRTSVGYKLNIIIFNTLCVFKPVYNSLSNQYLFSFVSTFRFYFIDQLFLSFYDLSIFAISHQFKMDFSFKSTDINLCFSYSIYFLWLFVSHKCYIYFCLY